MFAFILFSLALPFLTPAQTSYVIQGRIVDENNTPLKDMRVMLMTDTFNIIGTVYADVTGRYQFRPVLRGTYVVQVETAGSDFEQQSRRVDLASLTDARSGREIINQDFVLRYKKGTKPPVTSTETVFAQQVPEAAQTEFGRAVKAINAGKSDEAEAALLQAIKTFPDYFQALETYGTLLVQQNKYDEARPHLTHAIEVNPRAANSFYALGLAHLNQKRIPDAIEQLRKSVTFNPTLANAQLMLGYCLISSRQFADAEAPLKLAYQYGGAKLIDSQQYLAVIYDKLGRFKEAADALEIYIKEAPKEVDKEKFKALVERLKKKAKDEKK